MATSDLTLWRDSPEDMQPSLATEPERLTRLDVDPFRGTMGQCKLPTVGCTALAFDKGHEP